MKKILYPSSSRGHANHGWLNTHHSFSFANWFNPDQMHFGALRVLNDDEIAGGMGFGTHPHKDMEIVTIPLEGDLEHKDSMGNSSVIKAADVQVISAGTGIEHSEFNHNKDEVCKLLQIWVFPRKKHVEPRYDQITLDQSKMKNQFSQIVSPNENDEGVWVHQNTWFHLAELDEGKSLDYKIKRGANNGVYFFLLEGSAKVSDETLNKRDAVGIWDTESIQVKATEKSKLLAIEVPMENWED
ncbi:pirin family protein [Salibacter sp.]|uniref:pirin family protein n=1 Tax=Salibacter sp. TaxID=2010995 RepID=UPI002870117B|nr:pirin family protein [Salibacter sp.]MDR9397877.1 pirin family protein [Salibacter sp.]MDR9486601.1 pirin family protein [Salibacter sp.]